MSKAAKPDKDRTHKKNLKKRTPIICQLDAPLETTYTTKKSQ